MLDDLKVVQSVKFDKEFINEVLAYDINTLEQTDSRQLSRYIIALSQYLIYFKSKFNEIKVDIRRKQRLIDNTVNQLLTKELLKEYKTKRDATVYLVENTEVLYKTQLEIDELKDTDILLDGVDRTISELIASFKRELTRRENELWQTRRER